MTVLHRRKRRGSLAPYRQIPGDSVILAMFSTAIRRYTEPRPGKLSPVQIDAIVCAVASGRTLRDVAADFGISAERVRQLSRSKRADALAAG